MFALKTQGTNRDTVVTMKWLADARRTGQKDTYTGKRSAPRYTWQSAVTIEILDDSDDADIYATTRDISAGGLGIRTRSRLAAGTLVRISTDATDESLLGRVRHCSESLGGFYVGIAFESDTPAPRRTAGFTPLRRVA